MLYDDLSELPDRSIHELIEESRDADPLARVDPEWREYAQGTFRPVADPEQKIILGDQDMRDISQNLIGQCLAQIAGRLRFDSFVVEDEAVAEVLKVFSVKNRFPQAMISLTKRVQTDGNAAMSVSWKGGPDGRPVIHHELWWNGETGVFIDVSDGGDVNWAVSDWVDRDNSKMRTLYLPDRITRYKKEGEGWNVLAEIPWVRSDGRPMGVPFAHFSNGASPYGPYGASTVAAVIAAQDSLNSSLFARQAVVALTGMQIYWATGVKSESDLPVRAGTMWTSTAPNAKFGAIAPGGLEALLRETDDLRGVISGEFPVPSYRVGMGDWPSGLALQRADAPMIAAVRLLGDLMEPGLAHIAHRATEMMNVFGNGPDLNENSMISVKYLPPDEVDPGTQVEIDTSRAELFEIVTRLPEVLIRKLGILDEKEVEDLVAHIEEERKRAEEQFQVAEGQTGSESEW